MVQEDQTQKCSNSAGSGFVGDGGGYGGGEGDGGGGISLKRSNKKPKLKKIPQRGLGMAQLEKIRILEEQQKNDYSSQPLAYASAPTSILPSPSPPIGLLRWVSNNPSFLHPTNNQSSTSPRTDPTSPRTDLTSLSSVFGPVNSLILQNSDNRPNANSTSDTTWRSSITGNENLPKLCSSCRENENPDPGLGFHSFLELPCELSPMWPLPRLMQRAQQYQAHSSVHLSQATSSSSSSVLNYQMEPPSNQSYHGNYTPMWPEEEKMVGRKRPYPFSVDNPSGPLSHYKFLPIVHHPNGRRADVVHHPNGRRSDVVHHPNGRRSDVVHHPNGRRSDDSVSCIDGANKFNFELCNTSFRDGQGPSCSTSITGKSTKENGITDGGFLTLALPTTPTTSGLKLKDLSTTHAFFNNGVPNFDSFPYYQGRDMDDSQTKQQQPSYYSFLPAPSIEVQAIGQQPQTTVVNDSCNNGVGEVGENVDLNLKL